MQRWEDEQRLDVVVNHESGLPSFTNPTMQCESLTPWQLVGWRLPRQVFQLTVSQAQT